MKGESVVVVGGGASGAVFASQYKKMVRDARLTLLDRSAYMGWSGCPMPYFIANELDDKAVTGPGVDYFINKLGIDARLHTEVVSIDSKARQIEVLSTQTGDVEFLSYDKLVLAMGAKTRRFTAQGCDAVKSGYFHLVHPTDSMAICAYLEQHKPKKAVLMGTGSIGLEMAEAFVARGLEVTMFTTTSVLFPGSYDRDLLEPLYQRLEEKGVKIHFESQLESIQKNEDGTVTGVTLVGGEHLEANLFFTAIGVEPNLQLAQEAGLAIVDHRIHVSEFMQTSDPNIYALGDLVGTTNFMTNRNAYAPLGDVADKQALVLAGYLSGKKQKPYRGVYGTITTSFFDIKLARTGFTQKAAREAGYEPLVVKARVVTKISSFPDSATSGGEMQLVYDAKTTKILGAAMVGHNAVAQFIDQVAIALRFNATLDDMFDVDYAYSPTNSSVWNPFLVAYRKTLK